MNELIIEILMIVLGGYFVICATWKRDFFLYKLKAERLSSSLGERGAHVFYRVLGAILIVGGILQALDIWVL